MILKFSPFFVESTSTVGLGLSLTALMVILGFKFHATWCVHHGLRHTESLLSIALQCSLCHLEEGLFDIITTKGTSLVEEHVIVFACPLLSTSGRYLTLRLLIQLVT